MVALPAPPEKGPFAPAPLDRVQALVNTRVLHHDPTVAHDRLDGPDALVTWWHDMGRPVDGVAVTEDDVEAARTAREGLRALLALHNDSARPDDKRAIERLDALAAGLPLRISFGTTDRVDVLPLAPGGTRGALLELLASIPDCRADGTWSRLKVCRADDCREAFYDASRNRSRAWCSMDLCGGRAKQRAFAERHRRQD